MLQAIESGYVQREIQEAAFQFQKALEAGEEVAVGVNRFKEEWEEPIDIQSIDPAIEVAQSEQLAAFRARRDDGNVAALRGRLENAAQSNENLMPLLINCVENDVTLGEICHTLRQVWGEYQPDRVI
jgi:methylmalonyl-CoA mutase N-terminal domain/subunit